MPDRESLLGSYHNLQEKYPEEDFPDFELFSSEGIADDDSYGQVHLVGGLLSNGLEFIHDHYSHILKRLERLLAGASFYEKTERLVLNQLFSVYRKIYMAKEQDPTLAKHSEKLSFIFGMMADVFFSLPPGSSVFFKEYEGYSKGTIEDLCEDRRWQRYMEGRFPTSPQITDEIKSLWEEVEKVDTAARLQSKRFTRLKTDPTRLKESILRLVENKPLAFLDLQKEGFSVEDLEKFDESFLNRIVADPSCISDLKAKGLSAQAILNLRVDQQKIILQHFDDLMFYSGYTPLPELLTFKDKYPLEPDFDRDFWDLTKENKVFLLQHPECLSFYNDIGLFIRDLKKRSTKLVDCFAKDRRSIALLEKKGISVASDSSNEVKWFLMNKPEESIAFLRFGISIESLMRLSVWGQYAATTKPVRLGQLIWAGASIESIVSLSDKDQMDLIMYSQYLFLEITRQTSKEELSALAKQGAGRNRARYESLLKEDVRFSSLRGWENNPEMLTLEFLPS